MARLQHQFWLAPVVVGCATWVAVTSISSAGLAQGSGGEEEAAMDDEPPMTAAPAPAGKSGVATPPAKPNTGKAAATAASTPAASAKAGGPAAVAPKPAGKDTKAPAAKAPEQAPPKKDVVGSGRTATSGLGVSLGFGYTYGNGVGLDLAYYVQLSEIVRLVPHFGGGVFFLNETRPAGAGGLMLVVGRRDRFVLSGAFGLVDHQPEYQPATAYPDLASGVANIEFGAGEKVTRPAKKQKDIFDFTAAVGYERMEEWGLFLRAMVGASIFTQDVSEESPLLPAFNIAVGYKIW